MPRSDSIRNKSRQLDRSHHSRTPSPSGGVGGKAFDASDHVISIDEFKFPDKPMLVTPSEVVSSAEGELMTSLLKEITDLKVAVRGIESHLGVGQGAISLREMTDDAARAEILTAFQQAGDQPLYYDDISEKLRIPIDQVARLCETLIDEGALGEKIR